MIDLDPKAWKTLAGKFKIKDIGLEKALVTYEKLAEDAHDECLKTISTVTQLASTLKKTKEVVAVPPLLKYLGELVSAAETERNEVAKLKAIAAKEQVEAEKNKAVAAKAHAEAQKAKAAEEKADGEEKKRDDDAHDEKDGKGGHDDKQAGGFKTLTLSMLQKVKVAKPDAPFQYLYCEAKPFPCVVIAKQINAGHRKLLEKMSGGSKRFLKPGFVTFEDGHYVFASSKDIPGAARGLQGFFKNLTGKKFPVMFGTQKAADEEGAAGTPVAADDPEGTTTGTDDDTLGATGSASDAASAAASEGAAAGATAPKPIPELAKGTQAWEGTCDSLLADVKALSKAIQTQCAGEPPGFSDEINGVLEKLHSSVARTGRRLAESLSKANNAPDSAARKAELARCKAFMAETIKDLKPLAILIDTNPFVKTGFSAKLTGGLTVVAQGITRAQAVA